jgi:hypothetical protein
MERHHQVALEEGRVEINFNTKPNPLVHILCTLYLIHHIGETFGFKVALLIGCWQRRERAGTGRLRI